jgi:hypothetical protein
LLWIKGELKMKLQTKILLALAACTPALSSAMAGPTAPTVNPSTVTRLPTTPLDPQVRRALVPAPATGPCLAELSLDRIEISRRAGGGAYDVTVTVNNIGTEAATGDATASGGVLGIRLELNSIYQPRDVVGWTKQVANITVIPAGASRSFGFSLTAAEIPRQTRTLTFRIDRGPDGPRCAYDARRNNDGLGLSAEAMRAWHNAGNTIYVRTRL